MLPRTHFLFGMLVTAALSYLLPGIGVLHIILGGMLSAGVDIDHLLRHLSREGNLSVAGTWMESTRGRKIVNGQKFRVVNRSKWAHGWQGLGLVAVISMVVFFVSPVIALIIFFGFISHIAMDLLMHYHDFEELATYCVRFERVTYPIRLDELILDVFIIDILLVLLLLGGLV